MKTELLRNKEPEHEDLENSLLIYNIKNKEVFQKTKGVADPR